MPHIALFLVATAVPLVQGQPPSPAEVLDRYLRTKQAAAGKVDQLIEVEIDASIPRLKKQGRMTGLKLITKMGGVVYQSLRFSGDARVKTAVIGRFLSAESRVDDNAEDLAICPRNYRIDARGTSEYGDRAAYVYRVAPRRKKVGLFKGEVWLDSETALPLREWGEFVKSPSIFVRRIAFVHDYVLADGRSTPRRLMLTVRTILVGNAEITVWYRPGRPEREAGSYLSGELQ